MNAELDKAGLKAAIKAVMLEVQGHDLARKNGDGTVTVTFAQIDELDRVCQAAGERAITAYLNTSQNPEKPNTSPSRVDGDDISAGTGELVKRLLQWADIHLLGHWAPCAADVRKAAATIDELQRKFWEADEDANVSREFQEIDAARALAAETSLAEALRQRDELVEGLRALHDAIMDGLCNGGTPAYDKDAPERLDNAITTASRLILAASPQTPLGAESVRGDE